MDSKTAQELFSKAYQDRETVEVPIMLRLCSFNKKTVLEIGDGKPSAIAPLIKKTIKLYKTVASGKTQTVKDKSFDIVICRWHIHESSDISKTVSEMCRIAKESIIINTQSEAGDFTKLKMIRDAQTANRRKKRLLEIKQSLSSNGFAVHEIPVMLDFSFKSFSEALEVFMATEFNNSVSHSEMEKIQAFLKSCIKNNRVNLKQGAEIISGTRRT